MRTAWLMLLLSVPACDRSEVESDAKRLATAATSEAQRLSDGARAEWDAKRQAGAEEAARYVDERLRGWAEAAKEGSIESYLAEGASSAQMVAKIASAVAQVVDGETTILPVYRRIDAPREDIDRAIGDMPRTEVIDGLTVGFKELTHLDTEKHVTEKGYLVLWRQDDHLVGFVYRSKKEVDLAAVVKHAPAIIDAVRQATAS